MKFKFNEEGKCPLCGSQRLEYFGIEPDNEEVYFPWHCPECDADGKEWYYTDFEGVELDSGEHLDIEVDDICPECNGTDMVYGEMELEGDLLVYTYYCGDCDSKGKIYYGMDFDSHTIDGHEGENIEMITENKSIADIEDKIEDSEAQLKNLKKETIDYKDDKITVTTAEDPDDDREYYGRNMTKRDKVRSLDQAKRNLDRMEKDPRVTRGQAIDQVSFDSALDTDFARYKHNKDMAKIDKAQGNDFWADEHNKTAKQFADKIRAKHKKQEDVDDEEKPDIDFDDTISLLDMALSEVPKAEVEDWGKDNELLFLADTKVLFENLKDYEEEIPKYYYDNVSNDDWSNGIDNYLEEIKGVDLNNGDSDNTYNWNAPLTHDVEFTIYEAEDGCYFKGSIHRAGDVRGNYTTEFLLKFNDKDDCLETLFDTCSENCYREVKLGRIKYIVEPHFFDAEADIYNARTGRNYDDVYCTCIEELKEIIATEESGDYL